MASSDDEEEAVPQSVTNYHFTDDNDAPFSFTVLPLQWGEDDSATAVGEHVFLKGVADSGLQKIYKQVIAWKLDLSDEHWEISVLSKDHNWIKLQSPRRIYEEEMIRSFLISVHCLHFAKKNPEASDKAIWDHLRKLSSKYDVRASENDLLDHLSFIDSMVKRDEELAKSQFLRSFLEGPKKRKSFDEDCQIGSDFIVKDGEGVDDSEDDGEDEFDGDFDSVCAICDNGGELLCCDGKCLRSFHATEDAGEESSCYSLGMSKAQLEAIQKFLCKNCEYNQHQCFACGKLGPSDKSNGAEVFKCVSASCGYFYHPKCVAKLLHPGHEAEAEELEKKIASGESFFCPIHKCHVCKKVENKDVKELQLAICRRCPTSYHRKCMPREICFEEQLEEDDDQRAWDDLIPGRILIYCMKHPIDEDYGTPPRDHIKFPDVVEKKKVRPEKVVKKKNVIEDSPDEKIATMKQKTMSEKKAVKLPGSVSQKSSTGLNESSKKPKATIASKEHLKDVVFPKEKSASKNNKARTKENSSAAVLSKGSESMKSKPKDLPRSEHDKTVSATSITISTALPKLDSESEEKIMAIVKSCSSSLTLEGIMKMHKMPSTHTHYTRHAEKIITQGMVEGYVEALQTALRRLEEGCSIEDAKAVCEPKTLTQIIKWKNKLKVYLSPFLHGMRYTSFGRHFTKVDKLNEIVEKLHWYVQNGDMIVDFCCGANDFSRLMKEKLDQTGKKCSFKNFDLFQPKHDFCFERRDWMTVRPKELPTGSQLVMGLNPPFGVKAALANKFIDKALEFKPKLLILIVPQETERLDEKQAYDLIWEDGDKLSGKSFYLPGSIDVHDKQMEQWNMKPPLLYLWSRSDWTKRHKAIAIRQGHISKPPGESVVKESHEEAHVPDTEEGRVSYGDIAKILNDISALNNNVAEEEKRFFAEEQSEKSALKHDSSPYRSRHDEGSGIEGSDTLRHRKDKRARDSLLERKDKKKQSRGEDNILGTKYHLSRTEFDGSYIRITPPSINSPSCRTESRSFLEDDERTHDSLTERENTRKQSRAKGDILESIYNKSRTEVDGSYDRVTPLSMRSPSHRVESRSFVEDDASVIPMEIEGSEENIPHARHDISGSASEFGTGFVGTRLSIHDEELNDIERRYRSRDDPHASGAWSASSGSGVRGLDGRFSTYTNNTNDRNPYMDMNSHSETFGRQEVDPMRYGQSSTDSLRWVHLYGQQDPSELPHQGRHSFGQASRLGQIGSHASPFGLSPLLSDVSRVGTSVLQRYAPRLDEMNFTRSSPFLPMQAPPQSAPGSMFDISGSGAGVHSDMQGFATGSHRHFPHGNSTGWFDD